MENTSTPHAVLVSSPGMGHLIPVFELSKRLSSLFSFKVTILFITTQSSDQSSLSQYSSPNVDLIQTPAADISHIVNPEDKVVYQIGVLMRETGPAIRAAISGLTEPKPTVLIFDMFATEYVSMGREFKLPKFVYVPCSAWFLALTVYCPVLDKEVEGEYTDQTEPLKILGCKPVQQDEVVDPMMDRSDPQYKEYFRIGVEIPLFDGVLSNTWQDLEVSTLSALRDRELLGNIIRVPVYDIGPIARATVKPDSNTKEILEWLNQQPSRSVVYVSFGSGGTLSTCQMNELAFGLETSQQRFVWVVRPPTDGAANSSYFGSNGEHDELKYLPNGFMERTRDFGLLVVNWGPQLEILSHKSVGGFLTHCGWNSIIESITNGVPMIAWPLYAEQKMNARMLVEELKIAIRPRELPGKKVVERDEVERMVRTVLEGEEGGCMRTRVEELQKSGVQALSNSGSSYKSFSTFIANTMEQCMNVRIS